MLKKFLFKENLKRKNNQIKDNVNKKLKILPLNKPETDDNSDENKKLTSSTKKIYLKEKIDIETSYDEFLNLIRDDETFSQYQENYLILNNQVIH